MRNLKNSQQIQSNFLGVSDVHILKFILSNTFQSWDLKLLTELDEWQNALGQHNVQVGERAFQVAFDLLSPELINTRMHLYTIYNFIRLKLLAFLQTLPQYCKSRSLQQIRWMNGM